VTEKTSAIAKADLAYAIISPSVAQAIRAHGPNAALAAIVRLLALYRDTLADAVLNLPPEGRA
jgi:hypothetical protein